MTPDNDYIGGFHAVNAALKQGQPLSGVWLAERRQDARTRAITELAEARSVPVHGVDMATLDAMLPDIRHQGCVAQLSALPTRTWRESDLPGLLAAAKRPWVLALDQVQDPHNLGACLRSAAAAGVTAVIAPRKRAAGLTPTVHKVAVGAVDKVPFIPVTNLTRALKRLQNEGLWVVGLTGDAAQTLYETDLCGPVVLVLGNEARGLRALTAETCDIHASLPMANDIESLNISVAAGIALFEAVRQQRIAAPTGATGP